MLAPYPAQWTPNVTVDQAGAIAVLGALIEERSERSAADEAVRLKLCPSGLIADGVGAVLVAVDAPERFHGPAFAGGSLEQPAWMLQAARVRGDRLRRAQDRMMKTMSEKGR